MTFWAACGSAALGAEQSWPGFGDARIEGSFADDHTTSVLVKSAPGREAIVVESPAAPVAPVAAESAPAKDAKAVVATQTDAARSDASSPDVTARPPSKQTLDTAAKHALGAPKPDTNAAAPNAATASDGAGAGSDKAVSAATAAAGARIADAVGNINIETDIPPAVNAEKPEPATSPSATRAAADEASEPQPSVDKATATAPAQAEPVEAATAPSSPADAPPVAVAVPSDKAGPVNDADTKREAASNDVVHTTASPASTGDGPVKAPAAEEPVAEAPKSRAEGEPEPAKEAAAMSQDNKAEAGNASRPAPSANAEQPATREKRSADSGAKRAAKPSQLATDVRNPKPVYYDKRAAEILAADAPQAPSDGLKQDFPDHNMVSCLAGCDGGKPEVVQVTRVSDVISGEVVPTSADAEAAPAVARTITCIAGCYDKPRRTFHSPSRAEIEDSLKRSASRRLAGPRARAPGAESDSHAMRHRDTDTRPAANTASGNQTEMTSVRLTRFSKTRRVQFD